jgi:hypothetical protein
MPSYALAIETTVVAIARPGRRYSPPPYFYWCSRRVRRLHFQSYPFSLSSCPGSYSAQTDPISTVFYGSYTGYGYALNAVQYHLGWRDTGGSTQYFSSHDYCAQMRGQRASDCSFGCSRFHLRVGNTYHSAWGSTMVATPHHEDWV